MYETIQYSVDDPIATITLNRPDRLNALTGQMLPICSRRWRPPKRTTGLWRFC